MSRLGDDDFRHETRKYLRNTKELTAERRRRRSGRRPSPAKLVRRGLVLAAELGVVVFIVALAAAGWIFVHALDATSRLSDARTDIQRVRFDLLSGRSPLEDMRAAQQDASAAKRDTHDFVWAAAGWLSPVRTVRGITTAIDELAVDALPRFVSVAPSLRPEVLRVRHNKIAIAPLVAAAPAMERAAAAANIARTEVAQLPSGWLGLVATARSKVLSELTSLAGTVDAISRFTRAGPTMLGEHGTRRYFVGIQNNAEARATGGLIAAYAVVTARHGTIHVVEHGNDGKLQAFTAPRPVVSLAKDYETEYGNFHPAQSWITSNLSPNFPDAGRIWAHMWQAQTGEHVDGVFGVDPVALAGMLGTVGSISLPGYPGTFNGGNLAAFIESTEYAAFPGLHNNLRKQFLAKIGTAVLHKLLSGTGNPQAIATALGRAAGDGHLELWSRRAAEQRQITGTPLAGELSPTTGPFASVSVDNASETKLDYYLERTLEYDAGGCSGPRRDATIRITLTNDAPLRGLPDYVRLSTNRSGQGVVESVPNNRLYVFIHATTGATLLQARLDGKSIGVGSGFERGHPVYMVPVFLKPGVARSIVLSLSEPVRRGAPTTKVQPLARPQVTDFNVPRCG